MALQLILGNSGSGKTEYLYREIVSAAAKEPRRNFLCLVPEQYTLQTQKKLVDLSVGHAIMNIDVLSFQRLAFRVFDEMGMGELKILEETGKNLVLRKVAQQNAANLKNLGPKLRRMGYISEIKSLVSELMQYNITPSLLEEVMNTHTFSPALMGKLRDVLVMYRGFVEFLEGSYITNEDVLNVLMRVAGESAILKDAVLVLDEFTGFTPVQVALLTRLFPIVSDVYVTLTIDSREDFYHSKGMQELFDMPKKTIQTLLKIAKETGTEVKDAVVLSDGEKKRFCASPALFYLEQNLFRPTYAKYSEKPQEVGIYSFKDPKDELTFAARTIRHLVQEEGYRYGEIAVVTADMDSYGPYVENVCRKYQIPYFLDASKEVIFHPFIEFVRGILEMLQEDFSYHSVMRLLRTGYCRLKEEETDHLENYLLATGIRGKKDWSSRWLRTVRKGTAEETEQMEALRQRLWEHWEPLVTAFEGRTTVEEKIRALYGYITTLQVEEQLMLRETELSQEGDEAKAAEYKQIYAIVMDVFEKCIRVLGSDPMTTKELAEILDSGFEAAKVAVIPPGYDSVTVGDIERTRLGEIRILFFLGVNEGLVPKTSNTGGLISRYERQALEEAELTLAPGTREQSFIQRYYLYLNMTKPSEHLYLGYSRVDNEGKALRPSYLIRTIERMFPALSVTEMREMEQIPDFSTMEAAKEALIFGERDEEWYALAKCFLESEDEKIRKSAKDILEAFHHHYQHDPISRQTADAIYGKTIEGSVTRLEQYAKCAYAHFLSYGLHLREREESGFESVDMGNLYHAAVEIYGHKLRQEGYEWRNVPEEEQIRLADDAMEEATMAYPNLSIYANATNAHMVERMHHIFRQTIWALTTQIKKGDFDPKAYEVSFSKADHLKALEFDLENDHHIRLMGRIDRMDLCQEDERIYVKVIDYKSGKTSFDLLQLYRGLQLQLVIYMNAALEIEKKNHPQREIVPAGMFYYHIDDPVVEVTEEMGPEEIKTAILRELKPDGVVNAEESVYRAMDRDFETKSDVIPVEIKKDGSLTARSSAVTTEDMDTILEYANNRVRQYGEEIFDGCMEAAPFVDGQNSSCDYCPYSGICGFDRKVEGYRERTSRKMDRETVVAELEMENRIDESLRREKQEAANAAGEEGS